MLTPADKTYILHAFLRTIFGIASKEYQERVWIRGEGPECDDFDETVCHFFDDGDPILEQYKSYLITDSQYQLLTQFHNAFHAFCHGPVLQYYLPQEFIHTPEWQQIMEMAQTVLDAFHYKNQDNGDDLSIHI